MAGFDSASPDGGPGDPQTIVTFWRAAGPRLWFAKDAAFDTAIRARFEQVHIAAAARVLDPWRADADGALALILLFDQFPRNLWRGSARAFATDPMAREVARAALARGHDQATPSDLRIFFYLPFSHGESLADQDLAVHLGDALERAGGPSAASARKHRDVIRRFGRFPHRNPALGRATTAEEQAFLDLGGFAG